ASRACPRIHHACLRPCEHVPLIPSCTTPWIVFHDIGAWLDPCVEQPRLGKAQSAVNGQTTAGPAPERARVLNYGAHAPWSCCGAGQDFQLAGPHALLT